MSYFKPYTLRIKGGLFDVNSPIVMGILNVTPDSFYAGSRCYENEEIIRRRVRQIIDEGAEIIDIGGYSSRPNAADVSPQEEWERLEIGLRIIKEESPEAIISVDTFRATVAEKCIDKYGVDIINDISAGQLDSDMIPLVGACDVPYIMMHMRGTPDTMMSMTDYEDVVADILAFFSEKINEASNAGINDIIIDPGFGFSKTVEQNYELLAKLSAFKMLDLPILAGVSRKSMIYKLLSITPDESLNGTTVVNTLALLGGASILRVHDVRQAVEAVTIVNKTSALKV